MELKRRVRVQWIALGALCVVSLALLAAISIGVLNKKSTTVTVVTYAQCLEAKGAKILETAPEQCIVGGRTYVNPAQKVTSLPSMSDTEDVQLKAAYVKANGACSDSSGGAFTIKKMTVNGWAEMNVGCEPGSGHLEVWHKVNGEWTYVIGFQEGPFCTMVIDKQISKELYATCITTESGPTSTLDTNGNPTIPNQIP